MTGTESTAASAGSPGSPAAVIAEGDTEAGAAVAIGRADAAAAAGEGGAARVVTSHRDGDGAPSSFQLLSNALSRCNPGVQLRKV